MKEVRNEFNVIVVLPGQGCEGCISTVEAYLKENINNMKILFVMTNLNSVKILNYKLGIDVKKIKNIHIDYDNAFSSSEFSEYVTYPYVVYLDSLSNEVLKIDVQKPGNYAIDNIPN